MICQNCNQKPCACAQLGSDSLIVTPSLKLFDPAKFADFAQDIFKATSLKPFDPQNPTPGIQRISHGATRHARLAMWVRILANLCKAHGIGDEEALSERNIRLLQYAALFHDAARKNDHGEDIWKEASAAACQDFLVKNGISAEEAERFSSVIIKKEDSGLLGKILQSADCLECMRRKKVFHVEKMSICSDLEKSEDAIEDSLIPLVKDAGRLIQAQSDMRDDLWVTLHGKKVIQFKKSRDAENTALKEKYELADNCYAQVAADLEKFPLVEALYAGSVRPPLEEKEEYKEEEGKEDAHFFEQPEILSYAVIVKEALPAKENLQPKEIYLQKTGSKLAYVFLTPDGELAQGLISRREIPLPADFSQETVTGELKQTILQWLLKNETAVVFQKALRVDQNIFVGDFIPMIGEEGEDEEEEDEKQEEDAEENKALNKITLRKAREEKKGIYIVKRGKIFVSDLDEAGKIIFYGTHEDGTSNGIKLAPRYTKAEKKGYSKPQSVSAISDKIPTQRVFGSGRAKEAQPVVALFPQRATLPHGYFSRYDAGTVGRPGDFASYEEARKYLDKKYGGEDPSIRTEQAPFIDDLSAGKNIDNYTEAMMRLKWVDYTLSFSPEKKSFQKGKIHFWRKGNTLAYTVKLPSQEIVVAHFDEKDLQQMGITLDTLSPENFGSVEEKLLYALRVRGHALKPCCLGLPENHTLSSRILAQNIAQRMQAHFGKKPRIVYMAAFPKEVLYTEALQKQDREAAEEIAADPKKLSKALAKNDFYFLLGLAPERLKAILDTHPQARLLFFYAEGYVDFVKQLAARAEIDLNNLKEIVRSFDWASMWQVHPVAVQDLALHYPDLYKTLKYGVVNATNAQGKTALDAALYFGRLKLAVALLGHNRIPEMRCKAVGGELLTYAMRKGYKNMAQKLFRCGHGPSALAYAAEKNDEKMFKEMLEAFARDPQTDPNAQDQEGKTILMWAAEKGHVEVVTKLLTHLRMDPNRQDKWGKTALMLAAENSHAEVVTKLLTHHKTDPNAQDQEGKTILIWSAEKGHVEVVTALLTHLRMDPNRQDEWGKTALMLAAENGHAEVVTKLLTHHKMDPNAQDQDGKTTLIWAAENGHVEVVTALLTHLRMDPNLQNKWGQTALMLAAENGHAEVVTKLLTHHKMDPNRQDKWGKTAVICAAGKGHIAVVEALLTHHLQVGNGGTALMLAAEKGHIAVVEALLTHHLQVGNSGTVLMLAAEKGHIAVVRALLRHPQTNPNLQVGNGGTVLMRAAEKGHIAVVRALLRHPQANPNLQDRDSSTALMWAARNGHIDVVEALRRSPRTELNLQDKWGHTALMWAARNGCTAVVEALLRHPQMNPNLQDEPGQTALIFAAQAGCIAVVEALLRHPRTNPNLQNMDKETALILAAEKGHTAVLEALLAHPQTDPNLQDKDSSTALMWAARNGHLDVVRALLGDPSFQDENDWTVLMSAVKLEINPNIQNGEGKTALIVAVENGHIDVVRALLAHPKTNPNLQDRDGQTPLMVAVQNGHIDVVKALLTHPKIKRPLQNKNKQTALSLARGEDMRAAFRPSPAAAEEKQDAQSAAAFSSAAALGNSLGNMWQPQSAPQPPASNKGSCLVS